MISFRVSEREFELLKSQAESEGARNVSEFARIALCNRRPPEPDNAIDQLRRDLDELKSYVRRVAEVLEQESPRPPQLSEAPAAGPDPAARTAE